jgi:hypothetical protein
MYPARGFPAGNILGANPSPAICIHKKMDCVDDKNPEPDATEMAAAELVAKVKKTDKSECELPIVDESSVWIVSVKKVGIKR